MKRFNKAFTLTELLVALGVISILCAVLLPIIFNLMPNQNIIMAKRAYYAVQTAISDLMNDETCYPDRTYDVTNKRVGFDDGFGNPNCLAWPGNISTEGDQKTKFITLFTDRIGATKETGATDEIYTTTDGIRWAISNSTLSPSATDPVGGSIDIVIDVNGENAPNCGHQGVAYTVLGGDDASCTNRENGFDRFRVTINADGKVTIDPDAVWAINAVKVNRNITSEKNSNEEDDSTTTTTTTPPTPPTN